MTTFNKRGVTLNGNMSRNKREGYYMGKLRSYYSKSFGGFVFRDKPRFTRGAARIDSLCKFRTAGG